MVFGHPFQLNTLGSGYKKLKDNTPPILDEVIQGKKEDLTGMWISGLNFYNQDSPIDRYWKMKTLKDIGLK